MKSWLSTSWTISTAPAMRLKTAWPLRMGCGMRRPRRCPLCEGLTQLLSIQVRQCAYQVVETQEMCPAACRAAPIGIHVEDAVTQL